MLTGFHIYESKRKRNLGKSLKIMERCRLNLNDAKRFKHSGVINSPYFDMMPMEVSERGNIPIKTHLSP